MTRKQAEILRNYYSHINRAYREDYANKSLAIACEKVSKQDGFCSNYTDCKGCPFKVAYEKAIEEINNGLRDYMNIEDQIVDNAFTDTLRTVTKRIRYIITSGTMFYVWSITKNWHWADSNELKRLMRATDYRKFVFYDESKAEEYAELMLGNTQVKYTISTL